MELQYIVMTIIKILISVPAILLVTVDAAALIGGHQDNVDGRTSTSSYDFKIDLSDSNSQEIYNSTEDVYSEEIPNPSPLIVSGYNLPENLFNRGKPFYGERDPLTGNIGFKPSKVYEDDFEEGEVEDEETDQSEYDKSSIDRRDGPISGSHKTSDINRLTTNFHDYLNLPVKYNSNKYVYPLISSSYANTKVQGNVNKHQNHKNYIVTTYKPTMRPTYFTTKHYFSQDNVEERQTTTTTTTTTTTPSPTYPSTTHKDNLSKSPMNHPSFNEEYPLETTTKRAMGFFEQIFGDYDYSEEKKTPPPKLFNNLPANKPVTTEKNVLTGSQMSFDYDDYVSKPTEKEYDYYTDPVTTPSTTTTTTTTTLPPPTEGIDDEKVTSLPLGENHVTHNNRQPIIVATTNIREKLNHEKVISKFNYVHPQAPSTSNIHIAPDQDTVSFVVGNHQNVEGGSYVGSSIKESPYEGNPFRPMNNLQEIRNDIQKYGSSVTIQPIRSSEETLSIGIQVKPGQVVDEKLELDKNVEFPKGSGPKIVFPDEKTTHLPDLSPPPLVPQPQQTPNREILKLSSKPMYHPLPSNLTPPEKKYPARPMYGLRPPWDPRPGHFHTGRPQYDQPPRTIEIFKRIDEGVNEPPVILPQFRPNIKNNYHHNNYHPKNYARQPLLERPSNRPIAFFEKLQPPPLPPKMNKKPDEEKIPSYGFPPIPPKVVIANRRSGDDPETLQMIQAKKDATKITPIITNPQINEDNPLYVVYPVKTPPLHLDAIDSNKKESVVIGTRAELPLPPSKIEGIREPPPSKEFNFELTERHDSPILKPHPRPSHPIKSDFPYPLERPDPSILHVPTPEVAENILPDEPTFISSNQWNTIEDPESRIITSKNPNQISATLKTYTDRPIAVAYTPTEPNAEKFAAIGGDSEFTVSAVMHTHPQLNQKPPVMMMMMIPKQQPQPQQQQQTPEDTIKPQDFQAPFQASVNLDHTISQGWHVIRDKEEPKGKEDSTTSPSVLTTSEFDIENFKPQLEGGFKPIYSFPDAEAKEMTVNERQE
ncbi:PREDICTED: uncharacterized protein LOC108559715 [Nicrophorus vespilloides]|uniref:Uncharacterized protein LOC108559715 n=1 Tax=Nicrophorus vespilloides TaxID=110193 RepID=A0ABM1MD98_NICVS|nr:PREDICTED: uncharacterized protein LOC108559715 [Nicrophorus vespilloides]